MSNFAWTLTADALPCEPGNQVDVLFGGPGWATWLKGMYTRHDDGPGEWAVYDQQNDRFYDWDSLPELWALAPKLPKTLP